VINLEYLDILRRKTMEKVIAEEIREGKWKEKEEKQAKRVVELSFATNQAIRKCVKKGARAKLITTSTPTTIIKMGDCFHQEF
jgi:hypothetical protein